MLQPITPGCDLFAMPHRRSLVAEPDLDELLRDPLTQAVMAADHVDRGELQALLAQVSEHLR